MLSRFAGTYVASPGWPETLGPPASELGCQVCTIKPAITTMGKTAIYSTDLK